MLVDQCNVGNSIINNKNSFVQCWRSNEKTQTWQGSFILKYKVYFRCFLTCAWQTIQHPTQNAPPSCHTDKQALQLKAQGIWCMHKYSTAWNYLGICHGFATVKTQIQSTVWPRWNLICQTESYGFTEVNFHSFCLYLGCGFRPPWSFCSCSTVNTMGEDAVLPCANANSFEQ